MIDSEVLRISLIGFFDRPGNSKYHASWRAIAGQLRKADLEPLIKDVTQVLHGAESWCGVEPKGADSFIDLADKLEEAHVILERDDDGWFRLGEAYTVMEERLSQWAVLAREVHRGQGSRREG